MSSAITRIRHAISRHSGFRGLSLVLAFAWMWMTWPQLELHSHAHGDQTHSHAVEHAEPDAQVADDSNAPSVMHVHDASTPACALLSPQPPMCTAPVAVLDAAPPFSSPALTAQSPPHRPPIV